MASNTPGAMACLRLTVVGLCSSIVSSSPIGRLSRQVKVATVTFAHWKAVHTCLPSFFAGTALTSPAAVAPTAHRHIVTEQQKLTALSEQLVTQWPQSTSIS